MRAEPARLYLAISIGLAVFLKWPNELKKMGSADRTNLSAEPIIK
ncbi:MAG: hypothetical protein JWP81_409 [Ferruginibacter sp.]|nr:hypothetical protein [Ferruginibacter sp.]